MTSLILQTATRVLMPLLLLFAAFLLWRGHNQPGGGFVGGLVVASSFVLYSLAFDIGVFLAVVGVVLTIVFTLAEASLSEE